MAEVGTSRYLRALLEQHGVKVRTCGGTGLVAVLRNGDGGSVAFRADMDGLPVREATGLRRASTATALVDGVEVPMMHACGHDIHMTVGVGLLRHLQETKDAWRGTVILILQPGEETAEGARAMLEDGVWDGIPRPDAVFGLHVWPGRTGTAELVDGVTMAAADSFEVVVRGVGGHGSEPQHTVDPVVTAAHMVVALQTAVSRGISPLSAGVVTVGTFHAGTKENVIPDEARFSFNVRSLDAGVRETLLSRIRRIISGVAAANGAPEPELRELSAFPLLRSDPALVQRLRAEFAAELGDDAVTLGPPRLASEDFGLLGEAVGAPNVYWFIGGHSEQVMSSGDVPRNHSPQFAPDPAPSIETGVRTAYRAVRSVLG